MKRRVLVWPALAWIALAFPPPVASQALLELQSGMEQIARRARPSVVTVFAQRTTADESHPGGGGRLHTRVGSGVAVEADLVLTTASVVLDADRILVRTTNGLQVEAELRGLDPISNLAVLRVPSMRLPPIPLADPAEVKIGDFVISLGTSYRAQPTQAIGNIAVRHREPYQSLLQLTNTVYPGNSGAAALNARGELIGIVQGELGAPEVAGATPGAERRPTGVSFALPIENVKPVYLALSRYGRVRHGYLGVTTRAWIVESDFEGGASTPLGALVESVVESGPAARAGLRKGDLIVAYQGERVEYPEQLARWVASTPPGTRVELVWVREETGYTGYTGLLESPQAVPPWIARGRSQDASEPAPKVTQLEREIRRLNDELARLKERPPEPRP